MWWCIVLGGLALFFGNANPLLHVPLLAAGHVACAAYLAQKSKEPFRFAWLSGWLGASAALYWLAVPVHDYGGLPWILALPCPLILGAWVGLWTGIFAKGLSLIMEKLGGYRNPWLFACVAGLLWYLLEWTRGWMFTGFPWLLLSAGQAPWPVLIQGLGVVGAYGLSGLLAGLTCLALQGWLNGQKKTVLVALLLLLSIVAAGALRLAQNPPLAQDEHSESSLHLALVQGNIRQDIKWSMAFQKSTVETYLRLSRQSLIHSPDLIIWPETAMPFHFQQVHNPYADKLRSFVQATGVPLLFGGPGYTVGGNALFNRAFLLQPSSGEEAQESFYDKEYLVPFGEYVPPGFDFPIFSSLLQGMGGFSPGIGKALEFSGRRGLPLQSKLGMLICYEAIFPELARQRVEQGANVFINISNDAWYNFTSAPKQHLHHSLMRAVEQNRWLARGSNTGISAFVDPFGRIISPTPLFEEMIISAKVQRLSQRSIYYYLHPYLPGLALLCLLLLCWKNIAIKSPKLRQV